MGHRGIWASVLCGSLLGILVAGAAGAAEEHPAVRDLSNRGVLKAFPAGKFEPNKPVTRLELAITLARLLRAIESNPSAAQPARPPKPSAKAPKIPAGVSAAARGDFRYLAERGYTVEMASLCGDLGKPVLQKDLKSALVWTLASLAKRGYIPPGDLAPPPPDSLPAQ